MEESIKYLKEQFGLGDVDIRTYSPLVLAYIGDYEPFAFGSVQVSGIFD